MYTQARKQCACTPYDSAMLYTHLIEREVRVHYVFSTTTHSVYIYYYGKKMLCLFFGKSKKHQQTKVGKIEIKTAFRNHTQCGEGGTLNNVH